MVEKQEVCKIYVLTNTKNGKLYIGQTWAEKLEDRMGKDGSQYNHSIYLYNAILKHGAESFKYQLLDECYDQETADAMEDDYIVAFNTMDHDVGYNLKRGGSVGKHTDETKQKISNTLKVKYSLMTREEILERAKPVMGWWKGKKQRPRTEEETQAISVRMLDWHADNTHPMLGKRQSKEAAAKIGAAAIGRKRPEESNKRIGLKLRMSREKEDAIIAAYLAKKTLDNIEIELNTGTTSIYRVLRRNNIIPPAKVSGIKRSQDNKHKISQKLSGSNIPKDIQSLISAAFINDISLRIVSDEFGYNIDRVRALLKELGLWNL